MYGSYRYSYIYFNPRSLAGATFCTLPPQRFVIDFNPRSLAGATQRQRQKD